MDEEVVADEGMKERAVEQEVVGVGNNDVGGGGAGTETDRDCRENKGEFPPSEGGEVTERGGGGASEGKLGGKKAGVPEEERAGEEGVIGVASGAMIVLERTEGVRSKVALGVGPDTGNGRGGCGKGVCASDKGFTDEVKVKSPKLPESLSGLSERFFHFIFLLDS